MKRICAALLLCAFVSSYPFPQSGALVGENIDSSFIEKYRILFTSDKILYVNGGVTYNFPVTFDNSPILNVSVELISTFDPAITYAAFIYGNTATAATIIVNKISYNSMGNITTVAEAATGEVVVHLWAVDQ